MEDKNNKVYEPIEPYEAFGVECGDGWKSLYSPILDYIEEYNKGKEEVDKIYPLQIKEKFGSLRIYLSSMDETLEKMVDEAEEESFNVCENCGSKNDVGMAVGGWMYTTCFDCLVKSANKKGTPILWVRNSDNKRYWIYGDGHKEEFTKYMP